MKTAIITGSSRGLGYLLAEMLAKQGFKVYAGVRKNAHAPMNTIPLQLDITSEADRQNAIARVLNECGNIDLIIHNAGQAYWGGADSLTIEELHSLYEVNYFGPFRLTQLALPIMRKQLCGRIVFISSVRAIGSCAYMGAYSGSKAALESVAFDWSVTNSFWGIKVSVVEPGPMDTNIDIKHGSYFKKIGENPYFPYPEPELTIQSTDDAAKAIVDHIEDPNPPFRFQTSEAVKNTIAKHLVDHTGDVWKNEEIAWLQRQAGCQI